MSSILIRRHYHTNKPCPGYARIACRAARSYYNPTNGCGAGSRRLRLVLPRGRLFMGYNRSGVRRTARMKRRKKLEARLAQKAAPSEAPQKESLAHKVKEMAKSGREGRRRSARRRREGQGRRS